MQDHGSSGWSQVQWLNGELESQLKEKSENYESRKESMVEW